MKFIATVLLVASAGGASALRAAQAPHALSRRALPGAAATAAAALALAVGSPPALAADAAPVVSWEDVSVNKFADRPAALGDTVTIDYVAWFDSFDGKEFSRVEKPIKVTLGQNKVTPGLEACMLDKMTPGSTRRCKLTAPYGATGLPRSGDKQGSVVPPNTDIYFQVHMRTIALSKGVSGLNLF